MRLIILMCLLSTAYAEPKIEDLAHESYQVRTDTMAQLVQRSADMKADELDKLMLVCVSEFRSTEDMEYKLNLKQLLWNVYKQMHIELKIQEVEQLYDSSNSYYNTPSEEVYRKDAIIILKQAFETFCIKAELDKLKNPWDIK